MKMMGLDYGDRTLGVAVSDAFGWTAQGIETIRHDGSDRKKLFSRLSDIMKDHDISTFVLGLPKNMNNTIGERGQKTLDFGEELKENFGIEVVMWDERLTTMAAERMLLEADVSRKKRKKVIDKMAAVLILQSYLDHKEKKV